MLLCWIGDNVYFNGTAWVHRATGTGNVMQFFGGDTVFSSFATGAAGSTVTQAEKVRITASGNVGIGTTSPSYLLHVNGSVAGVGAYNQLSDARYKKQVKTLAGSLAKILAIRGVTYRWIDEEKYGSNPQIGVLAQEIEKIVPEVVDTGHDGVKRVKYSDLVPLVIEAMKEDHADAEAYRQRSDDAMARLKAANQLRDGAIVQLKAEKDAEIAQLRADSQAKDAEIAALQAATQQLKAIVCRQSPAAAFCH